MSSDSLSPEPFSDVVLTTKTPSVAGKGESFCWEVALCLKVGISMGFSLVGLEVQCVLVQCRGWRLHPGEWTRCTEMVLGRD